MDRRPSPAGPLAAIGGASLVLVSLWLPWYELRLPDALREAFRSFGAGQGASGERNPFGGFFEGLAAVLPESMDVSGWQAMEQGDVALALLAALVLMVGLAAGGILGSSVRVDPELAGRLTALMGAAALAVAVYHVVTTPGADFPGADEFITPLQGIWVAVIGSALMIAGGILSGASAQRAQTDTWTAGFPAGEPAPGSAPEAPGVQPALAAPAAAAAPVEAVPTPVYTAAPATSTAPPGFGP